MIILLCLTLIIISILIILLLKNSNLKIGNNILITLVCTLFILSIVLNPEAGLNSALNGVKLFVNSVFISIFPFLVLINIMMYYDGVNIYSKVLGNVLCKPINLPKQCSVVLIISILCGYPLGAKYACDLYENGTIDHDTCERLISIASNPSPLFVIGAIGTSMLNNPGFGLLLLISSYVSCAILAIIIPQKKPIVTIKKSKINNTYGKQYTIGHALKSSIDNAFKVSISIGGFIIFFSVISSIIKNNILFDIVSEFICEILKIQKEILQGAFLGLIEMTNGSNLLSSLEFSNMYKLIIISFLITFSGLSIISQTYSITYKYDFSLIKYVKRKLIQGTISSLITLILYNLNVFNVAKSVFSIDVIVPKAINLNIIIFIQITFLGLPFIIKKSLHRIS